MKCTRCGYRFNKIGENFYKVINPHDLYMEIICEECHSKIPKLKYGIEPFTSWVECKWCNGNYSGGEHPNGRRITVEYLPHARNPDTVITCRICKGYGSVIIEGGKIHTLDEYLDMDSMKLEKEKK